MTSTPIDQAEAAPDVRDLDASAVLDAVVSARRAADAQEARLLALAVHWVDLHPVTPEHPPASFPTQRTGGLASALGPSFFDRAPLAGVGTPAVAEYAVEELAAALGLSHAAGLSLVSEAVEVCYRLPRLWALVQDGSLQGWKARRVARATTQLSPEAVAFVDRHLAVTARSNRIPPVNPVLHEARLRCDPDQAAAVEQNALDHRGVWLDHRESTAITLLTARLDTLDALDLDGTITDLAGVLGRLGDDRDLDVRRASALGMLAHPQRALDLAASASTDTDTDPGTEAGGIRSVRTERVPRHPLPARVPVRPRGARGRWWPGRAARHRLPGTAARLAAAVHRGDRPAGARPDPHRRGRRARPAPLDARARDPPRPALRVPRLQHRRARACDLDHLQPYTPMDDGGPPGQTSPANLACLCRRHHRAKTFAGWHYRRLGDDDTGGSMYEWTSPHLRTYRVTIS
jgi:hypothetical protein